MPGSATGSKTEAARRLERALDDHPHDGRFAVAHAEILLDTPGGGKLAVRRGGVAARL